MKKSICISVIAVLALCLFSSCQNDDGGLKEGSFELIESTTITELL